MKVAELTGELLDAWVARAEGYTLSSNKKIWDIPSKEPWDGTLRFYSVAVDEWKPSANWVQGGQIIEREGITLITISGKEWSADVVRVRHVCTGPTPLIAAMRAYVASKYGDTVPDEV